MQTLYTEHHWILKTKNYLRLTISADLRKSQLWESKRLVQASDRVKLGIRSWSVPTWHWPICHFLDSECIIRQHQNPEGLLRPYSEFPWQTLEVCISNQLLTMLLSRWHTLRTIAIDGTFHFFVSFLYLSSNTTYGLGGAPLKGDYLKLIFSDIQWLYIAHLYMSS